MDASGPGLAVEMAVDQGRQGVDVLGGFLHQQQVRLLTLDQRRHVLHLGPGQPQEVPANDLHAILVSERVAATAPT